MVKKRGHSFRSHASACSSHCSEGSEGVAHRALGQTSRERNPRNSRTAFRIEFSWVGIITVQLIGPRELHNQLNVCLFFHFYLLVWCFVVGTGTGTKAVLPIKTKTKTIWCTDPKQKRERYVCGGVTVIAFSLRQPCAPVARVNFSPPPRFPRAPKISKNYSF